MNLMNMPHNGLSILLTPNLSPQGSLTVDQFLRSRHQICKALHSAISLPELVDGPLPCKPQAGPLTDLFGQALAPASHSAQRETMPANQMSDTYGRIGQGSSQSVALQRSLANRLQTQFPQAGWMMSFMTWKRKNTPARRQYCQLAVQARPTDGIGSSLWPTPQARDWKPGHAPRFMNKDRSNDLNDCVAAVMWATPRAMDGEKRGECSTDKRNGLPMQAIHSKPSETSLWPTPTTMEGMAPRSQEAMKKLMTTGARKGRSAPSNLREAVFPELYPAMWSTPVAHEARLGYQHRHADAKGSQKSLTTEVIDTLGLGKNVNGGLAPMENRGQLNPAFTCWLMGFPAIWDILAPRYYLKSSKTEKHWFMGLPVPSDCTDMATPSSDLPPQDLSNQQ